MAYQFPLNGGRINASIGGNSTSAGAGYSLVSTGTLHLMGGNNVTLSQNANSITISGAAIPSQTAYSFADSNGVSFGTNGSTVTATVATNYAASNHSHGNPTLNLTNLSGTTASASNGLTLSLSAAAQSVQTQNMASVLGSSGNISFANANNVTFGGNASTITASASFSQSNQNVSLYALGNTTQNSSTLLNASNLSFNGLGGATVGFSNGSIQISGNTNSGGGGVALYDGVASISSGTARLSAGGALTASVNGQTLSLNAPATSSLSASGAVSIATNGSTISIGAPSLGTVSNWEPLPFGHGSLTGVATNNATQYFHKLQPQAYITATQLGQLASYSVASDAASSQAGTVSIAAGIYTANGSTLSLITQSSGTTSYSWSITGSSSSSYMHGLRNLTLPMNINMSPGNYWIGVWSRTSGSGAAILNVSNLLFTNGMNTTAAFSGLPGQAVSASQGVQEAVGYYSVSTSALRASAAMSAIAQSNLVSAAPPYMAFKNTAW